MGMPVKELVVISGKGGTGKSSIAASFAALAGGAVTVDCDVDAADLHLVLSPSVRREESYEGGWVAVTDRDKCMQCGLCARHCRFGAVMDFYDIDPLRCEGCGVCADVCPHFAIDMKRRVSGRWFVSDTPYGPFVHARLGVAEGNSGKLVSRLKTEARAIAAERGLGLIIADGSPGIGCPVIASLAGANAALIVTEPTVSGIHDMRRVAELAGRFRIKTFACVNRCDVNEENTAAVRALCGTGGPVYAGDIPTDRDFTRAQIAGKSLVEFSDGPAARAVKSLWERVSDGIA